MVKLKVPNNNVDALEFQATQAYEALKRAISTKQYLDAVWSKSLYATLGYSINEVTRRSDFMNSTRAISLESGIIALPTELDGYILQYVVGSTLSNYLINPIQNEKLNSRRKLPLKGELDIKTAGYPQIGEMVKQLCATQRYGFILDMMEHIRNSYPYPNPLPKKISK